MTMSERSHEGRCTCGSVRYRMNRPPMIVHACHCTECQRLSGGAFAINALVERDQVELLRGEPVEAAVTGTSGKPQAIMRCPNCRVALWSHYPGAGPNIAFVRVGTLDEPGRLPPDIHIYTSTKLPWLELPSGARAVDLYYSAAEVWSAKSRDRFRKAREEA
jgi:hypothetical protein